MSHDVLPADLVARNRRVAATALRPWAPVFIHGDLQVAHVFVVDDEVSGARVVVGAEPGAIRWLAEHGFDPAAPGCEIDVLTAQV